MANENLNGRESESESIPTLPAPSDIGEQPNIGRMLMEPLNHAMAVGSRKALELGVPAHSVLEMHMNHLASVVAMLEPAAARADCIQRIIAEFGPLCQKHIKMRFTSPGGVILPKASGV